MTDHLPPSIERKIKALEARIRALERHQHPIPSVYSYPFADDVVPETSFGLTPDKGSEFTIARGDHTHGTPELIIPSELPPYLAGTRQTGGTAGDTAALHFHSFDSDAVALTSVKSFTHYRGGGWGLAKSRFCCIEYEDVAGDSGDPIVIGYIDASNDDPTLWTAVDLLDVTTAAFTEPRYDIFRYIGPTGSQIAFLATPTGYTSGKYALYLIDGINGSIVSLIEHVDVAPTADAGSIIDYAFSIDGTYYAVWGLSDTSATFVRVFDRATDTVLLNITSPGDYYQAGAMAFSEDGAYFYYVSSTHGARVYRTSDWGLNHTIGWYASDPAAGRPPWVLSPNNSYWVGGVSSFFFNAAPVTFWHFAGTVVVDSDMGNSQWRPDGNNADWTDDEAFCFVGGGHTDTSGGIQSWSLPIGTRTIHSTDDEILARWRPFR